MPSIFTFLANLPHCPLENCCQPPSFLPAASLLLALSMSPIFILFPQFSSALYESIMTPIKLLPAASFLPAGRSRTPHLFSLIYVSIFTFLTHFPHCPLGLTLLPASLIRSQSVHWPNSRMPSRLRHFCSSFGPFRRNKKGKKEPETHRDYSLGR